MPVTKNTLVQTVEVPLERQVEFREWQTRLNGAVATFPGFVSLEIVAPPSDHNLWSIVQRFLDETACLHWKESKAYTDLVASLRSFAKKFQEVQAAPGVVTEVFLTHVSPAKEEEYRQWLTKIHQAETHFPGFRGMYVQSPTHAHGNNWITFLQFDTPENLDHWLSSPERASVLKDLTPLVSSLESHRIYSPYAGWFGSMEKGGFIPPLWKQTMAILLVLYPIVVLEMRFLNPLLTSLHLPLAVFIGNALSVSLISWPFLPLAIRFLKKWLVSQDLKTDILGFLFVLALYALEITILWNLL